MSSPAYRDVLSILHPSCFFKWEKKTSVIILLWIIPRMRNQLNERLFLITDAMIRHDMTLAICDYSSLIGSSLMERILHNAKALNSSTDAVNLVVNEPLFPDAKFQEKTCRFRLVNLSQWGKNDSHISLFLLVLWDPVWYYLEVDFSFPTVFLFEVLYAPLVPSTADCMMMFVFCFHKKFYK